MAEPPTLTIEQFSAMRQMPERMAQRRVDMIGQVVISALAIGLLIQAVRGVS